MEFSKTGAFFVSSAGICPWSGLYFWSVSLYSYNNKARNGPAAAGPIFQGALLL
ncbi:hypothetical protein [Allofournierella sp. CML151]|uniref:hypothetical protein n=1 Tax=Allofournierella sp. CML151 TaxID=2998082 RepID=UPI0022EB8AB3|nr:hypothetical protein [Fournierella sp. CML151]